MDMMRGKRKGSPCVWIQSRVTHFHRGVYNKRAHKWGKRFIVHCSESSSSLLLRIAESGATDGTQNTIPHRPVQCARNVPNHAHSASFSPGTHVPNKHTHTHPANEYVGGLSGLVCWLTIKLGPFASYLFGAHHILEIYSRDTRQSPAQHIVK